VVSITTQLKLLAPDGKNYTYMDRVCGLDVHKDSVFMCILSENGEKTEEVFGTLTPELDRLRDVLTSHGVGLYTRICRGRKITKRALHFLVLFGFEAEK
jgi:hypothetical protein